MHLHVPTLARAAAGSLLVVVAAALAQAGGPAMTLSSAAFGPGKPIPVRHTCSGENLSPPLEWSGVPEAAESLALVMRDPDAPAGTWIHWVVYGIPARDVGLEEGVPEDERLDNGATHGASWGVDSFSRVGYQGPCPPPGKPHRYEFTLYALDRELDLAPKATVTDLERAMSGHVLARATLTGTFGR